jgi:hypothetical protein
MTKEEILEQQVEALEKLLQLKGAVIQELESKVSRLEAERLVYPGIVNVPYQPFIGGGSLQVQYPCTDGLGHNYPQNWGGTSHPACTKCGQVPYSNGSGWISISGSQAVAGAGGTSGVATSGYIAPAVGQGSTQQTDWTNAAQNTNVLTLSNVAKR